MDNIDRAAAAARGIVVTNTPNVLTDATADLTMALLLSLVRRVVEGDRLVRTGGFHGWAPELLLGSDLKGKVFGVLGPGRIGRAVARRARAFGMTVIAFGRSPRDEDDPDDPAAGLLRGAAAALRRRLAPPPAERRDPAPLQ